MRCLLENSWWCLFFLFFLLTYFGLDIKESQNIALLHNQITACDSILEVRLFISHCCTAGAQGTQSLTFVNYDESIVLSITSSNAES